MIDLTKEFSAQRLQFCIVLVAAVHIFVIFGITWHTNLIDEISTDARTLAVTLTTQASTTPPEHAKLIAPQQQLANNPNHGNEAQQKNRIIWQPPSQAQLASASSDVVSTQQSEQKITKEIPVTPLISQQVAELRAELLQQQQEYERDQQKTRIITAAAYSAADAEYLHNWQAKIESVGNLNYPVEARNKQINGELLLLVAINADGTLRDAQIRQSSGSKILDEAALHIVRLAAPFAPLPAEVRKDTDVLEIIRTWQFTSNKETGNERFRILR